MQLHWFSRRKWCWKVQQFSPRWVSRCHLRERPQVIPFANGSNCYHKANMEWKQKEVCLFRKWWFRSINNVPMNPPRSTHTKEQRLEKMIINHYSPWIKQCFTIAPGHMSFQVSQVFSKTLRSPCVVKANPWTLETQCVTVQFSIPGPATEKKQKVTMDLSLENRWNNGALWKCPNNPTWHKTRVFFTSDFFDGEKTWICWFF